MNFTDYSKDKFIEEEEDVKSSSSINIDLSKIKSEVNDFVSKTAPIYITIEKDSVSTKISYNINSIIPTGSNIVRKDIIIYGYIGGGKKLVSSNNNLIRTATVDNMYENVYIKVNVEYEYNNAYYNIDDSFQADKSKSITLNITNSQDDYSTPEELLTFLINNINYLNSRVSDLESKLNN